MTRAIRLARTGSADVLSWENVDPGAPGEGEVLLRQTAIGVNFIDIYHRTGLYPIPLPGGLGSEAAGVVEAIGPGVTNFAVGDRVAYAGGPAGAYAEKRVVPAAILLKVPHAISDKDAAGVLLKGMTAEFLLHRCFRVQTGDAVLFHAAAGGVGLLACQWLKSIGAIAIGTVSSEEKAALAKRNGCTHTINYKSENVAERVREITNGDGVSVVYDSVGKDTWDTSLDCLRRRGTMVSFGNTTGAVAPVNIATLAAKGSLYVTRPVLGAYTATRAELEAISSHLFDAVASGILRPNVQQVFALKDAAEAHRQLETGGTSGATVLIA
ncbi:quinone oxidoreductase family protein [Stappia sp. ICDLI1TA098]|jgi:NADPH2:quinone reductase